MKILIASDHAGFKMKGELVNLLTSEGYEVEDMGPFDFNQYDDYPDCVLPLALRVASEPDTVGILLGGSGQGEAIVANRVIGVRAAVYCCDNLEIIRLSREHNNANVLSVGVRFVSLVEASQAVKLWLSTPFNGEERHVRRIAKIDKLL